MINSQMPKIVRNFLLSIDFLDKKKIVKPSEKSLAIYDDNHDAKKLWIETDPSKQNNCICKNKENE